MKQIWLPSSDPSDTRTKVVKAKRSRIRAIDAGTRYDLTGNLRRLAREIERGEHGDVRDISVQARIVGPTNGKRGLYFAHYGTATTEEIHWMLRTAMNRIEPA